MLPGVVLRPCVSESPLERAQERVLRKKGIDSPRNRDKPAQSPHIVSQECGSLHLISASSLLVLFAARNQTPETSFSVPETSCARDDIAAPDTCSTVLDFKSCPLGRVLCLGLTKREVVVPGRCRKVTLRVRVRGWCGAELVRSGHCAAAALGRKCVILLVQSSGYKALLASFHVAMR